MLPEYCVDDPLPTLCCDNLVVAAQALLDVAYDGLADCLDPEACKQVQQIVAAAEPHFASHEYLAVWPDSVTWPPLTRTNTDKMMTRQVPTVTFAVKFVEGNYPTIMEVPGNIVEPLPGAVDWAGRISLAHAEQVYRSVIGDLQADNACGTLRAIGQLRSVTGGGLIGWRFDVTLDIKWN